MIVLDTNVISEPIRRAPDGAVVEWLNGQKDTALFTTSITVMELRFGLARLPEGKRKADLWAVLDFTLSRLVGPRILPFDTAAAIEAARIAALAEAAGTPMGQADGQIAAIARTHGFAVATRDADPFQRAGLTVINPWKAV
ncbi:type II toxin-antitoxin system VapC family toxin [Thioalkalivibrio sp.]|uniref:type II toxin-antitoxin system VapC family toxin n=1 Tax=Thioalkalivibrio sp. TaxID=2093813 RepID=UPI0012D697A4|nr:type II toxin-antitoxin system VapC family toxin [Thioalkalivibrio sp.]TVP77046.1 MAG: type II toxin-antitoxin system VapC family toxin [Thioalkalivibrio sp.]